MYKTLHKKQGSVTVQLRFARSSVTFCAKRDNSISEGISLGIISYVVINLVCGKANEKKISPLLYILAVLFVLKYIML